MDETSWSLDMIMVISESFFRGSKVFPEPSSDLVMFTMSGWLVVEVESLIGTEWAKNKIEKDLSQVMNIALA